MTASVVQTLLQRGIPTVFLSAAGRYRGAMTPAGGGSAVLRVRQFQRVADEGFQLELAKALVCGKIHNQRACLLKRIRARPLDPEARALAERALVGLRRMGKLALRTGDLNALRGAEGQAAVSYFVGLRQFLPEGFSFSRRVRRPPTDPVNAILSFSYTLLANEVEAALMGTGLDLYVGFLHSPEHGRPALVCDLMEEWRAPLADAFALGLLNNRILQLDDFVPVDGSQSLRGTRLRPEALRRVVVAFESKLQERRLHAGTGVRVTYRRAIFLQALAFVRSLDTGAASYEPFLYR